MADINEPYVTELVNLYHDAKEHVGKSRRPRMVWAAEEFHEAHPEIPATQAWRRLDKAIGGKSR